MGGAGGRPVDEGAAGVVWAATLPDSGPSGGSSAIGNRCRGEQAVTSRGISAAEEVFFLSSGTVGVRNHAICSGQRVCPPQQEPEMSTHGLEGYHGGSGAALDFHIAVVYLHRAGNTDGPVQIWLHVVRQPVMNPPSGVSGPRSVLFVCWRAHLVCFASRSSSTPAAYTACGCGHGGTRNNSTSRSVQT
jgi:hypothetical protein